MVRSLLSQGLNADERNSNGETSLFVAVRMDNLPMTKLLARFGNASVSSANGPQMWTPLHKAVARGNSKMVKFLVKKGADVQAQVSKEINLCDLRFTVFIFRPKMAGRPYVWHVKARTPLRTKRSSKSSRRS